MIDPALLATSSDDELARTLGIDSARFVDFAKTVTQNPSSTIEPVQHASSDLAGRRALAGLDARRGDRGIASGLDIERTLGEGGMGIVRLATQRSLGRKVAVKTLRPEARSESSTLRLLREAWVTGTLEHPNIVPVYDLGLDEEGSPIIVLKRIEGLEWSALMRHHQPAGDRFGAADLLEYNLRILIQLCNAVSLAHARGVLHRDLKPENVMIGSFGEVYLVDWGIAVSLLADPLGRLPLAAEQTELAGTPCYMAPEMLGAVGTLSERTDIYLLGAILHEILTGAPPHQGTFKQIIHSVLMSTFQYGADVPRELGEIAKRAMRQKPEERFGSAEELRQRLEWYLGHRGSLAISAEASRRLVDMETLLRSGAPPQSLHDSLYRLFAECRFGFRQAQSASPENEAARLGLRRAIETVVRFELDRGAPEAAAGVLAESEAPPPELLAQVNEALRARAAEKKRMERLERIDAQNDPMVGRRTRVFVASVAGVLWTVIPQLTGLATKRWPGHPHWAMYLWTLGVIASGGAVAVWGRESLLKTAVNRRMLAVGTLTFASQLALQVGGHLLGLSLVVIGVLHLAVWATLVACFAVMADARFWPAVFVFFGAFLVACAYPERRWDMMSAANFVMLITFVTAWWRPIEDQPRVFLREAREKRRAAQAASKRPPPP